MNVGEKIKKYRKRLNISGKELAQKLGVTPALISYYEQGKRQVPLKTLMQISEIIRFLWNTWLLIKNILLTLLIVVKAE